MAGTVDDQQDSPPQNQLEQALFDAKLGNISVSEFLRVFVSSIIFAPSIQSLSPEQTQIHPLIFHHHEVPLVAAFTTLERARRYTNLAKFCVSLSGHELLSRIPQEHGVVINPGYSVRGEISPAGVEEILRDFDAAKQEIRVEHLATGTANEA